MTRRFPPDQRFSMFFYVSSVPFTPAVLRKQTSLGGSESACRVTAEALAARGHDVHVFATDFLTGEDEASRAVIAQEILDTTGVAWHSAERELTAVLAFQIPDLFVALRMTEIFRLNLPAKCRVLWSQDLLTQDAVVGALYPIDGAAFVSQYQREQWCQRQPMLRPFAFVVPNPIDPTDLPALDAVAKIPHRFIHVSRPERGLDGLLAIWPAIRKAIPDATLALCRYSSMYDPGGFGAICAQYDQKVNAVHAAVGGLIWLGELDKPALYRAISASVAMLYPTSQPNFAETNCVACTEAQACGTPFVGAWKGALPETLAYGAGILIDGDVTDPMIAERWVAAAAYLDAAVTDPLLSFTLDDVAYGPYEAMQLAGVERAQQVTGAMAAVVWEDWLRTFFEDRYAAHTPAILRQLLHWDNHAPAILCADDILSADRDGPSDDPSRLRELAEAQEARDLCVRVIAQEEQTAEHYAKYAMTDAAAESELNGRLVTAAERVLDAIAGLEAPVVLDLACGNGAMALLILRGHADVRLVGLDYSPGVLDIARAAIAAEGFTDRATFTVGDYTTMHAHRPAHGFDAIFCGEFIEHVEAPWLLLDLLEAICAEDGRVVLTTPNGPFVELLEPEIPRQRGHVHAFALTDIATLGERKAKFQWRYIGIGLSPRGTNCGYWLISFAPGGAPAAVLDYNRTLLVERPYVRIVASMIVKDGALWLGGCLSAIRRVVDRVVLSDTGSTDGTPDLARSYGAEVQFQPWPDDFAAARNVALARVEGEAEWILWLDADELFEGGLSLRHYCTDRGPYLGYVVRQHHLMIDAPTFHDVPVRLFRTGHGIRFYGAVHEQPETALNDGIQPSLDQGDMSVGHLGYRNNALRRHKLLHRNLRLLMRTITSGVGIRDLDFVLYIRDLVNTAQFDLEANGGQLTPRAYKHLVQATRVHESHFADVNHKLHSLSWPFYQAALTGLGRGVEIAWSFKAAAHALDNVPPTGEQFRMPSAAAAGALIAARTQRWLTQLDHQAIDTAPVIDRLPELLSPDAKRIEDALREARPASFDDARRVRAWAWAFVQAQRAAPGPVLEIGTWKGASALVWLRLIDGLFPPVEGGLARPMVYTVDPYGNKPYGTEGVAEGKLPLFGDAEYVAAKTRLAAFPNHAHYLMEGLPFLTTIAYAQLTWRRGHLERVGPFAFVLLDGDHNGEVALAELEILATSGLLLPHATVILDNVDQFSAAQRADLVQHYGATLYPAKWGQTFAVLHERRASSRLRRPVVRLQTSAHGAEVVRP
jgi:2-polyprenyl-3-methyl-5-hydroxy-6-metoxy-1,4-benzoquinol methylase/glycosyltransferase involved in cell wall biosynthesis